VFLDPRELHRMLTQDGAALKVIQTVSNRENWKMYWTVDTKIYIHVNI